MKRSPTLQPLSREHHTALVLANACERAAQTGDAALVKLACQRATHALLNDLEAHFNIEEQTLLPLLQTPETQALVQRTLADHRQLRGLHDDLLQNDSEALNNFGKCLAAHVRFEERELFPALESLCNKL
jgi:iron-sulfur cluster repair protein YtfE (RIC family)